ncbi:zinc finger and BTB domain-containing protein 17-like isoform X3 [Ruditapes philippinarum]|uniref:zinc finger and BTB domain-containing protein 17-like isoform X3 n=1 Tax=Ruditapes philippinarum TaxID=129788 RepID=UPI00295AEF92|nr:zinc finger and BTB domain-containing protein 17-like isoform X3 [Ruditapes philippinarum]
MQAVTPPRYDGMGGGYMQHRSPRYHSPQQSPHPVALSRVAPGSRMRSPGNRHQPYPMARPARPTLSFDQQGRSPGQGPGPMVTPVRNTKLDGQVIKIEPEDEDEKSNQSANENTNVQSDVKTNISESSQPSSPSIKPSTPSQTQGPSASDNEDARSESSSSTIPNEASDLKFSDTNPAAGLSLDSDLSNILPTDSSVNEPSTSQGNEQGTMEGLDPNISVKLEAFGDSEMDLEITGVELGQNTLTQEQMSSQEWMANVQNVMQGASGSSADMAGQQGYKHDLGNVDYNINEGLAASRMDTLETRKMMMQLKHVCTYCGKIEPSSGKLQIHMRKHTGEQPYTCDFCPKTFSNKSNKTKHEKLRHSKAHSDL